MLILCSQNNKLFNTTLKIIQYAKLTLNNCISWTLTSALVYKWDSEDGKDLGVMLQ